MNATTPDFWTMYLKAHRHRLNRRLHALGTLGYLTGLAWIIAKGAWPWIPALPIWAYGCAWTGHFGVEGNRPATFGHPFLSLWSDHRMVALMLVGKLDAEFERLGIPQKG
mgnify:CR=1 FL=1